MARRGGQRCRRASSSTSAFDRVLLTAGSRNSRTVQILAAAVIVFSLQFTRGPAEVFLYDQLQYWGAPIALLTGGDPAEAGVLNFRGAYSAVAYLPPALTSILLGPESAPWTVLVWNGLLAAALCVGVLPLLAASLTPGRQMVRVWLCALLGGVALSGFGPYPLMDVWSAGFALTGVLVLLRSERWWTAVLGGICLSIATNLRPSYLAALLVVGVILLVTRSRRVAYVGLGVVVAFIPQVVLNLILYGRLSAVPVRTPSLVRVQSAQAPYTVRYDTVPFSNQHPQQWYCDPGYARLLQEDSEPTNPVGVLLSALSHLPQSAWFLGEKLAASLRWSTRTPFESGPGRMEVMAVIIITVSALGLICIVGRTVTSWRDPPRRRTALTLLGIWLGSVGTLVLSTPETRFALPLVLLGVIGIAAVPLRYPASRRAFTVLMVWVAISVTLVVLLIALGRAGVAHPAPAGPLADLEACIALKAEQ